MVGGGFEVLVLAFLERSSALGFSGSALGLWACFRCLGVSGLYTVILYAISMGDCIRMSE